MRKHGVRVEQDTDCKHALDRFAQSEHTPGENENDNSTPETPSSALPSYYLPPTPRTTGIRTSDTIDSLSRFVYVTCRILTPLCLVFRAASPPESATLPHAWSEDRPPRLAAQRNAEAELGIKRNRSLLALPGKGGCSISFKKLPARLEEGAGGGGSRAVQELAGFDRNCVLAPGLLGPVFRLVLGS